MVCVGVQRSSRITDATVVTELVDIIEDRYGPVIVNEAQRMSWPHPPGRPSAMRLVSCYEISPTIS